MTGSVALDVVIGLVFIYTLYSLLTTTITEIIATEIRLRPKFLVKGIRRMLDDDSGTSIFSEAFFRQPLIKYLAKDSTKKPAYLAARNFSKILFDVLKLNGTESLRKENGDTGVESELKKIQAVLNDPQSPLAKSETVVFLKSLLEDAQNDLDKFKANLEQWYDDTMERVSSWYKKKIQWITFFVGLIIACLFNVDTIKIVNKLSSDPVAREQFVMMAQKLAEDSVARKIAYGENDTTQLAADFKQLRKQALETNDALAMQREEIKWNDLGSTLLLPFLGWLLTAIALSLGAPFWFDLLNKLVKLRTSVRPSDEAKDNSSATVQSVSVVKRVG
jgi:hypothetical protein